VLEQVTGHSLEQIAVEMVFDPLQMKSSSYVNSPDVLPKLTYGHINYGVFLPQLIVVLAIAFVLTLSVAAVIQRIRLGRVALTGKLLWVAYLISALLALTFVLYIVGWELNKWVTLAALWMVLFGVGMALMLFLGVKITDRLKGHWGKPQNRLLLLILWTFISGLSLLFLTSKMSGPVPRSPSGSPNAAYSLRSNAPDLAKFLIELSSPQHLGPSLAEQMTSPQLSFSGNSSWGLGVGIQRSSQGVLLWHSGNNMDFHALMAINPNRGEGIVILTNGQGGEALTHEILSFTIGVDIE